MGLLDGGLQAIFGNVFGPLLLPGTLHKSSWTTDNEGTISEEFTNYPIKAMEEVVSEAVRAQAGIPSQDAKFIVLQLGVGTTLKQGDQITLRGRRWVFRAPIDEDPAQASWMGWASPLSAPGAILFEDSYNILLEDGNGKILLEGD